MSTAPTHRTPNHRPGTAELLVQLASELGNLLSRHVASAKLELGETARRTGLGVAQIAACAPLVLVATPSSMPPRRWRWPGGPLAAAVALVGVLNVVVGSVGVASPHVPSGVRSSPTR